MSTNYYLRKKPSMSDVDELKAILDKTLDGTNFLEVTEKFSAMYQNDIHLGKRSDGWQFLWAPNVNVVGYDKDKQKCVYGTLYPLTRTGITEFIKRDGYVVVNEYGELIDADEFLEMAFNWCVGESSNVKSDCLVNNERQQILSELGYKCGSRYDHDFFNDGLRFSVYDDFC